MHLLIKRWALHDEKNEWVVLGKLESNQTSNNQRHSNDKIFPQVIMQSHDNTAQKYMKLNGYLFNCRALRKV